MLLIVIKTEIKIVTIPDLTVQEYHWVIIPPITIEGIKIVIVR